MLDFYQHLPELINPIAFSIGGFDIRWYSVMYLIGFFVVYILLKTQSSKLKNLSVGNNLILDFLIYSFVGLIIGGRLGHVLFYGVNYYFHNPLAIVSPLDANGNFIGIYGMSYFGGLIGIIIASVIFVKRHGINFWQWADFIIPAVPAGYFFGRIGNFLNGELYGKPTNSIFGMYFNGENILRHPTQLYEAFFEGALLFLILWFFRSYISRVCFCQSDCCGAITDYSRIAPPKNQIAINKPLNIRSKLEIPGMLLAIYLVGYGIVRFFVEFWREQSESLILGLSRSQILSVLLIMSAMIIYAIIVQRNILGDKNDVS